MVYTVTYFNPLGNCDNIAYVEANNEVDAALIAHADFWAASKSFDLYYCSSCIEELYEYSKNAIKAFAERDLIKD